MSRARIDQRILQFQAAIQSFFENYDSLNPNSEENKTIKSTLERILRSFNPSPSTRNLLVSDLSLAFNSRNHENKSIQDIIIDAASVNKKAVPSLGFNNFSGNFQVFSSIVNIAMNRNKYLPIDIRLINSESFKNIRTGVASRLRAGFQSASLSSQPPPLRGSMATIDATRGNTVAPSLSRRLPIFPAVPTHEPDPTISQQEEAARLAAQRERERVAEVARILQTAPDAPRHQLNARSSASADFVAQQKQREREFNKALRRLRNEMPLPGSAVERRSELPRNTRSAFSTVSPATRPQANGRVSPDNVPEIPEIPSSRRPSRLRNAWNSFKGLFKRGSARISVGDEANGSTVPPQQAWAEEASAVALPLNESVVAASRTQAVGLFGKELEFYNKLSTENRELFLSQSPIDRSTIISAINEGFIQNIEEGIAFLNTSEEVKISNFIDSMQKQETKDQFEDLSKENQLTVIAYFEEIEPRSGRISDQEIIDVISNIRSIDYEEELRIKAEEELRAIMDPQPIVASPSLRESQLGQQSGVSGQRK